MRRWERSRFLWSEVQQAFCLQVSGWRAAGALAQLLSVRSLARESRARSCSFASQCWRETSVSKQQQRQHQKQQSISSLCPFIALFLTQVSFVQVKSKDATLDILHSTQITHPSPTAIICSWAPSDLWELVPCRTASVGRWKI